MTSNRDVSPSINEERRKQLRQLEHDMKTHLGVVTMGLQALEGVREDAKEFSEMSQTIEEEGVKSLKRIVAEIVAIALNESE